MKYKSVDLIGWVTALIITLVASAPYLAAQSKKKPNTNVPVPTKIPRRIGFTEYPDQLPFTTENERQLDEWANFHYHGHSIEHLKSANVEMLLLWGDTGSGMAITTLQVYTYRAKTWRLCLLRLSIPSGVANSSIDERNQELVVTSKTGKTFLRVSLATLSPERNFTEQ